MAPDIAKWLDLHNENKIRTNIYCRQPNPKTGLNAAAIASRDGIGVRLKRSGNHLDAG